MTLDMAAGHDLPRLWYESVTCTPLPASAPAGDVPRRWVDGVASYAGLAAGVARGPDRVKALGHAVAIARAPKVGAAFAWTDPLPGIVFGLGHLRHPRAFVRPFFVDVECPAVAAPGDGERPSTEGASAGAPWQPLRDSIPCRHLEGAADAVPPIVAVAP